MNKNILFRVLGIGTFMLILSLPAFAQEKIVAIVNNEAITQKDLNDFTNFSRMQLSREYEESAVEKRIESMKKDLLDKLIEDRLILQEAKRMGVKVDENRIRARLNEIKRRYATDAEFQKDLGRQGLVQGDLERRLREQLLMFTAVQRSVQDKVVVRPEEVTDFYNTNLKDFVSPEERHLEIMILDTDKAQTARDFLNDLRAGQKPEALTSKYPLTVDQIRARRKGELMPEIEEAVFKLNPGDLSDPLKVNDKYYVFRLNRIVAPRQLVLSEAQEQIQSYLLEQKMQQNLTRWLDDLRKKSYIKVMP